MEKYSFNPIEQPLNQYLQNTKNIVESVLLEHISVEDCAVLIRETEISRPELVAYIVSQHPLELEHLQFHLQEVIPSPLLPKAYIQVSNLPLTPTGEVDKQGLISLPVLDFHLAERIEKQL